MPWYIDLKLEASKRDRGHKKRKKERKSDRHEMSMGISSKSIVMPGPPTDSRDQENGNETWVSIRNDGHDSHQSVDRRPKRMKNEE